MINPTPEQSRNKYRGYNENKNEKSVWKTSPDPTQHTIVCFYEKAQLEPNWPRIQQNCKTHADDSWEQLIDDRRAIYVRVDRKRQVAERVKRSAGRANLAVVSGVAYPSAELTREVHQLLQQTPPYRFFSIVIGAIPDPPPCIYILCEHESVIYVGQAQSLLKRMAGHISGQKKPKDSAGFMDYARHYHECSADWSIKILPYEQCESLAVQGQLTPDLMDDQKAQHLLSLRYIQNPLWGLTQAEAALITYFRPHFNQRGNTYPHPLQHTDYCEQKCRLCLLTYEK